MSESPAGWLPILPDMSSLGPAIRRDFTPIADREGKEGGRRFGRAIAVGVTAVAGATVAAGKAFYELGSIFDEVEDTIRIGTGATGDALAGLVDVARNVGRQVPNALGDIGATVADLNTRLGLTGPTLETLSAQFMQAGNIMGESIDVAGVTAAFNAFKVEGDDTTAAMDHLFRVSQATGVGMNALAQTMTAAAPAVQGLGFSFEETAGLAGALDKAGLNASQIMMSMSRSLVTLAKDGESPAQAFERTVGEIEKFIATGNEAAAINLAGEVFGTRGASQFVGAIQSGTLAMEDLANVTGMTEDTILGVGEETADFAEQWQLFKNNTLLALEPVATRVFGAIGTAMGEVVAGIEPMRAAWEAADSTMTQSGIPGVMESIGGTARKVFDWMSTTGLPVLQALGAMLWEHRTIIAVLTGVVGSLWLAYQAMNMLMAKKATPSHLVDLDMKLAAPRAPKTVPEAPAPKPEPAAAPEPRWSKISAIIAMATST